MADYIVVGMREGKVAGHARTIDSLVRVYDNGETREFNPPPLGTNPGQDVLGYIDRSHSNAKAVITGELEGPEGYNKRAIINELEGMTVEEIVEKYMNGEYNAVIQEYLEKKTEETPAGTPEQKGDGGGTRAQKGRGCCDPEDQEEVGRGSGTKYGRKAEGKPRGRAYEVNDDASEDYYAKEGDAEGEGEPVEETAEGSE